MAKIRPKHRDEDPDPSDDVWALAPDQKQLSDQERARDVPGALEEAIGRRGGYGADTSGEIGYADMGHNRRIDEPVGDAYESDPCDRDHGAELSITYVFRPHESDQHEAQAAHDSAPEQNRLGIAIAIDQAGNDAGGYDHAKPIEHDELADILRPVLLLCEDQRNGKTDDTRQQRLRGNSDAEDRLEKLGVGDHVSAVGRKAPHRGTQSADGLPASSDTRQHRKRIQGRDQPYPAGDGEHALRVKGIHQQRADRHSGKHAALEAQHDDRRALGLLVGRGHIQNVTLNTDQQQALTDTRERPKPGHLEDSDAAGPGPGRWRPPGSGRQR